MTGEKVRLMVSENSEITDRVVNLLASIEVIHLDDVKNSLNYVLNDFEVKHKENSLAIANPDLKVKAIQNFFIAKKVIQSLKERKEVLLMEQELAYSIHLGSDKNRSKVAKNCL